MIFFGANDACLPGTSTGQHVPIERYTRNLEKLLAHPSIEEQQPRLILVTPPPVNEYQLEEGNPAEIQRTAEHTRKYADSCRQVGIKLGIAVVDLWSIFMEEVGWKHGHPLIGSKNAPRSERLENLLSDGKFRVLYQFRRLILICQGCISIQMATSFFLMLPWKPSSKSGPTRTIRPYLLFRPLGRLPFKASIG